MAFNKLFYIFTGAGCALTGQQTDVIITHYFRDKLTMAQRIVRMAPSVGNCLVPLFIGHLTTTSYSGDIIIMIYGAILMQNCLFLASYTRPTYIEKVIRTTYNMLRDAVEDEDEIIFSNQNSPNQPPASPPQVSQPNTTQDEENDVVVFNSRQNAREIVDPDVQVRERTEAIINTQSRFSSDFSNMFAEPADNNRFSTNFGSQDIINYNRTHNRGTAYQELESIERDSRDPEPLYRETTVNAPQSNVVFAAEPSPGTMRRTANMKKNFITIVNMLLDINFYLYALLHLTTTFSILVLGIFLPAHVWEQNPTMNTWMVSSADITALFIIHGAR